MGKLTVLALRAVLAALIAGGLFIQGVLIPIGLFDDTEDKAVESIRIPVLVIIFLGVLAGQVVVVCVWRLLTMVKRGTVFSTAAFRYVDVIMGAFTAAALLIFAFAGVLAHRNRAYTADEVPPGIILVIGGLGMAALGVALVVLVLRMLLAQAIDRDTEANRMREELEEVI